MQGSHVDGLTFTVDEVAKLFGLARNSCYGAVRRGEIPSLRIGRRILIPRAAVEKMLGEPKTVTPGQHANA